MAWISHNIETGSILRVIPSLSYIICTTYRSGSWLLAEALESTGLAGKPKEYLAPNQVSTWRALWQLPGEHDWNAYLARMLNEGTTENGVFGIKIHRPAFRTFVQSMQRDRNGIDEGGILSCAFPNLRLIWLTRRDKVRQAVSWYRAAQTGEWWTIEGEPPNEGTTEPLYRYEPIAELYKRLIADDQEWVELTSRRSFPSLEVSYEDLDDDVEGTTQRVLGGLGVEGWSACTVQLPRLKRQSDGLSEWWVKLFHEHHGVKPEATE